jgi:hypothetical protein
MCTGYAKNNTVIFTKNRTRGKENAVAINNKASPGETTKP